LAVETDLQKEELFGLTVSAVDLSAGKSGLTRPRAAFLVVFH
jgi:hypothetical protein